MDVPEKETLSLPKNVGKPLGEDLRKKMTVDELKNDIHRALMEIKEEKPPNLQESTWKGLDVDRVMENLAHIKLLKMYPRTLRPLKEEMSRIYILTILRYICQETPDYNKLAGYIFAAGTATDNNARNVIAYCKLPPIFHELCLRRGQMNAKKEK